MPKVIEVIISEEATRGTGIQESPCRGITQVFTKEGNLIATSDFWEFAIEDMLSFGKMVRENPDTDILELFKASFNRSY